MLPTVTIASVLLQAVLVQDVLAFVPRSQKAHHASSVSISFITPGTGSPAEFARTERVTAVSSLMAKSDDDAEDDEDDIDLSDKDWRAFRAKLVMSEPTKDDEDESSSSPSSTTPASAAEAFMESEEDLDGIGAVFASKSSAAEEGGAPTDVMCASKFTPLSPDQWAYDSGKVIEQGAVILGGVEQDFGFGLRQQYFHKAVILVLDHDENQFTKGIILNKPTDRYLDDDINSGVRWRVWFGGDVQGLDTILPDITCLHSLENADVQKVSKAVMKDIQWTTFENAKKLVKEGKAKPADFWLFAGYAGWGPQQLAGELDRKSWYMAATDSQTLLKELARQSKDADPLDAGLDVWELLMNMIGRGETADECSGDFDDLMLKEWSRKNLRSEEDEIGSEVAKDLLAKVTRLTTGDAVMEGSLLRASSADRSPYLLSKQELHKSVVLVITDDDNMTVGVMLNRPVARGIELEITDKASMESQRVKVPLRFGGDYAIKGQEPMLWLHCNPKLRSENIGSEIGPASTGIWKCSQEEATKAMAKGIAKPEDFIIVSGVSVWPKAGALAQGLQGEVAEGNFEPISTTRVEDVWSSLTKQEVLTKLNFVKMIDVANEAWRAGGSDADVGGGGEEEEKLPGTTTEGIGEGYDEEGDDSCVHKTTTKVSDLADTALRSWVASFLLGAPTLGH